MIKILEIRQLLKGTFDGTDNYCQRLHQLFDGDPDCQVLPVPDIPQIPSRIAHFSYDRNVLRPYLEEADVIHVNGYLHQGIVDAMRLAHNMGKKVAFTAHFHPFQYLGHPLLGKLFFNLKMKPAIRKYADVVITINNEDTAFFKAFHHNVVQIPHWNVFTPSSVGKDEKKPNMILFVGRINDHVKNFQQLLALPKGKYDVHCVGKGELPKDRTDFTQHINIPDEELRQLYRKASLLVIPSKYEAFSYAAIEAFSQGTPVVMSDRVRIADYLEGVKGYSVFHFGNTEEFLSKVESTIGTEIDTDKVLEIFKPERISQKYKQMFMSL